MGGHGNGVSRLSGATPVWDRYAHMPRRPARLVLLLLTICLALAAWAPGMVPPPGEVPDAPISASSVHPGTATLTGGSLEDDGKDNDQRFYRMVIERVKRGDNYYVAAVELQRANGYPVAPALTVRLPTLAFVIATIGPIGVGVVAALLLGGIFFSNHRRFGAEPGGAGLRLSALALLFVGLSTMLPLKFAVLHEVWTAQLMALSFGLHRPASPGQSGNKWIGAWLAAAAALSIRELALPFVLLMGAYALWRRSWREAAA